MKINIVSRDKRYLLVKELLCQKGYEARICYSNEVDSCDVLLLSVRAELNDDELKEALSRIDKETVVLCGNDERIDRLFSGKIINYAVIDNFVLKNAYLTAEATVSFLHSTLNEGVAGKRIFVSGYGKIGKELARILKSLGAKVGVYARRKEVREAICKDGVIPLSLEECVSYDIIINTVPSVIYLSELIDKIPQSATIVELASHPYGFEKLDRVIFASGLPGKILSKSASFVVFDTVCDILSKMEKE